MKKEIKDSIESEDIIEWIKQYLYNVDKNIDKYGIKLTIMQGIAYIEENKILEADNIRKDLSEYVGRIVSIYEFRNIKDYGICG